MSLELQMVVGYVEVIIIMLYGMAILIGTFNGNPTGNVKWLTKILVTGMRKIVAFPFLLIGNTINPKKPSPRRRRGP